jgi:hypothetical protein
MGGRPYVARQAPKVEEDPVLAPGGSLPRAQRPVAEEGAVWGRFLVIEDPEGRSVILPGTMLQCRDGSERYRTNARGGRVLIAGLAVEGNEAVLHPGRVEKLEAARGRLRAPLSAIRSMEVLDDGDSAARVMRLLTSARGLPSLRAG